MNARKVEVSLRNLHRALDRLGEALEVPESNTLAIDGTIQRFEFALELFWKTLKRLLAEEGVETSTPKDTLRKAFQAGWLTDEAAWLQMLSDRNTTSHIYDEETAKRIYDNIRQNYPEMVKVFEGMANKA
ncbi:MAG: nucleotidyltransferase substrate binding protein [Alphaproteobacteria bacterium]